MTINKKLFKEIEAFTVVDPMTKEPVHVPVFVKDDTICISAEHDSSFYFLDYYGEYRGGYAYILEELEALAAKHQGYWEWENPGCIAFSS